MTALDNHRDYTATKRINTVTDVVFIWRHPERFDAKNIKIIPLPPLQSAKPEEKPLILERLHIRDCIVIPVRRVWLKLEKKPK
jgi:hypothetical protein